MTAIARPLVRLRGHTALLVLSLTLAMVGGGTALANIPKHHFVYEVTATIPLGGVGTVAVNPLTNMVYATTGLGASVDVINGATNALTAIIVVPGSNFLAVDPFTNKVYVTRYGAVSVIDGATNRVTATIFLPGLPDGITGVAVDVASDTVYVSGSAPSAGAVSVINGATNTVTATISMPAGDSAVGVAADPQTNTIGVAYDQPQGISGGVVVINGVTNAVTPVDLVEPQFAVTVDPNTGLYYSEGLGDLNTVTATAPSGLAFANFPCPVGLCHGDRNMLALDYLLHVVFASFGENGTDVVLLFDGISGNLFGEIPVPGAGPLAVNSATHAVYVVGSGYNTLTVISRVWV